MFLRGLPAWAVCVVCATLAFSLVALLAWAGGALELVRGFVVGRRRAGRVRMVSTVRGASSRGDAQDLV